jgi:tetratricopeptide (TPR) repeat protein
LEEAQALAERIGDRRRLALAALYESGYHWIKGDYRDGIETGLRGLAAAEALEEWELRGLAHYRIGQSYLFMGDHVATADHLRKAIAALDHEEGRALLRFGGLPLAFIASFLAWTLGELGEFAEAESAGLMGFELAARADHAYSISVAAFGLGHAWLRQGRNDEAARVLEQGYEQTKLHGVEAAVDQLVGRLVYAYSQTGRAEEARALEETMAPGLTRLSFLSSVHFLLAGMGAVEGPTDRIVRATREVHATATLRGERATAAWLEHLLGDLAMAGEPADPRAAAGHYRAAAAVADELGMRPLGMACHFGLGDAARQGGDMKRARSEFGSALQLAEVMGIASSVERARGLLDRLSSDAAVRC